MRPRTPENVRPVISVFTGEPEIFPAVFKRLTERLGPVDFLSEPMRFDLTDYYDRELGPGAKTRRIISFDRLVDTGDLVEIKFFTNSLEADLLRGDKKRRVNIDPGYITLERFVLLSFKNFSHRIHVGRGVYADLTLIYAGGGFNSLEWTYPDYRTPVMKGLLESIRMRYAFTIKRGFHLG